MYRDDGFCLAPKRSVKTNSWCRAASAVSVLSDITLCMCVCVLDVLFLARLQTSVLHGVRDETVRVRAEVLKESEAAKKKKKSAARVEILSGSRLKTLEFGDICESVKPNYITRSSSQT